MNCKHQHLIVNDRHEYVLNLPSVSKLVQVITGKNPYEGIDQRILDKAAARGNKIHDAIHKSIVDETFAMKPIDEQTKLCVEKFGENVAKEQGKDEQMKSERPLFCDLYCGTPDLVVELESQIYVIDFKTTADVHLEEGTIQLHLYAELLYKSLTKYIFLEIWHGDRNNKKGDIINIKFDQKYLDELLDKVAVYHNFY